MTSGMTQVFLGTGTHILLSEGVSADAGIQAFYRLFL